MQKKGRGQGAAALCALTKLVNIMAAGKLPKEVAPFLCGANLFAAIKKTGGMRPVAVGGVLRRLTAKCIMYKVSGKAAELLRPLQFGVGFQGGCEAVVHATRAILSSESLPQDSLWSLQVDLDNSFNRGDRAQMFAEVRRLLPGISPWVESCYGVSSILNFGDSTILSTAGVQQGDPLGPLLFSIMAQPVVERLQEVEGLVQNAWYLDDGILVGTREALVEAWDLLVAEGEPRGLHLSRGKSLVFCPHHDPEDQDPLGRGVVRGEGGGFKLLGAPLGDEGYEGEILEKRVIAIQELLDRLPLLEDPHMEYTLLRNCFAFPKFSFALRTTDTSKHQDLVIRFDSAVRAALEGILGSP